MGVAYFFKDDANSGSWIRNQERLLGGLKTETCCRVSTTKWKGSTATTRVQASVQAGLDFDNAALALQAKPVKG